MFKKKSLETHIETLATALMDRPNVKAVMMSKDEVGDVHITLVVGAEESHKVKFGTVERSSRALRRMSRELA